MDIDRQIELGLMISPTSGGRLVERGGAGNRRLETESGDESYEIVNGVPILLRDAQWAIDYAKNSDKMAMEYSAEHLKHSFLARMKSKYHQDHKSANSQKAFDELFNLSDARASVFLSIGGGPMRQSPYFTNLNIGPFPNVDLVADAHFLPYQDNSVDAVHSEAVFEHLYDPARAASEIARVLKKGSKAFIATPFLQAYHGYPHHYQNFTVTGHRKLFETAGLKIVEAGACVGPTYTICSLITVYIREYFPKPFNRLDLVWAISSSLFRLLDKVLANRPNAHILASTTYLVAEKQ